MSGLATSVLVVEDEPSQMELLSYNLQVEGFEVETADNGEDALLITKERDFDLIFLDWMLPNTSGIEVCRQLKRGKATRDIPIIMLTARGEEEDKIRGLDIGADDYIVKPYSVKELMARARAQLRRANASGSTEQLQYAGLVMDLRHHKVTMNGTYIHLGPTEFRLLQTLLEHPARVWSREQLLDRVWHDAMDVDTRTVDVHIGRLRKNLASASDVNLIRTVRGFGYSLDQDT